MNNEELTEKVRHVFAEQLSVDLDQVTLDASFEDDLDADSLDLVEAVLGLEEAFGIEVPEEEMKGVTTVRQAVDLVATKVGAGV